MKVKTYRHCFVVPCRLTLSIDQRVPSGTRSDLVGSDLIRLTSISSDTTERGSAVGAMLIMIKAVEGGGDGSNKVLQPA